LLNIICFRLDIQEKGGNEFADTKTESIVYEASSVYIQEVVDIPLTGKKLEQRTCIAFSHCTHFLAGMTHEYKYYVVHLFILI
jgi:hypothetical protein